jgi:hypothetical protein
MSHESLLAFLSVGTSNSLLLFELTECLLESIDSITLHPIGSDQPRQPRKREKKQKQTNLI